jgi:spore germination protein GerM
MDIMDWRKSKLIRLLVAGLSVSAILLLMAACNEPASQNPTRSDSAVMAERSDDDRVVHLYFANSDQNALMAEQRSMPAGLQSDKAGVRIIQALLEGPKQRLERTIPTETRLRGFYILDNRTAYVDLSNELREYHPGGARSELLTIYSIVNSLTMNLTDIETVKILIDGQEVTTLSGHMDLRFPMRANLLYVR